MLSILNFLYFHVIHNPCAFLSNSVNIAAEFEQRAMGVTGLNTRLPEARYTYNKNALLPGESYCTGSLSYKYIYDTLRGELYPVTHDSSQKSELYNSTDDSHQKDSKRKKQRRLTLKPSPYTNKNKKTPKIPAPCKIEDSQIEPNICDNNLENVPGTTEETNTDDQIFKKPADIPEKKPRRKKHQKTPENRSETNRDDIEMSHEQVCVSRKEKQERMKDFIVPYCPNISNSTLGSDQYNTTPESHQKKPKRRKQRSLNLKPTSNKKTKKITTPRKEIEAELSQQSCSNIGKKVTKQKKAAPKGKFQTPMTDNEEDDSPRTPPRPLMHKRRTLYSPGTFELSADAAKVFSGYV